MSIVYGFKSCKKWMDGIMPLLDCRGIIFIFLKCKIRFIYVGFTCKRKHRKNCKCCPGHYMSTSVY